MNVITEDQDARYREILVGPIRACADYLPKMGGSEETDLDGFVSAYGADAFYKWVGLDSPLMFAAHKAAGGMTSIYRQLGIGSERLFREVLKDEFGLSATQVVWSYELVEESTTGGDAKTKILALDGRLSYEDLSRNDARERVTDWVDQQRARLDISIPLRGAVFEVRQGYKSADSKRQNADLTNAAQALGHGYLPVLVIMSNQVNRSVVERYSVSNWSVLRGVLGDDAAVSTFAFLRDVVGYDLAAFFERNSGTIRGEVESILTSLLEAR